MCSVCVCVCVCVSVYVRACIRGVVSCYVIASWRAFFYCVCPSRKVRYQGWGGLEAGGGNVTTVVTCPSDQLLKLLLSVWILVAWTLNSVRRWQQLIWWLCASAMSKIASKFRFLNLDENLGLKIFYILWLCYFFTIFILNRLEIPSPPPKLCQAEKINVLSKLNRATNCWETYRLKGTHDFAPKESRFLPSEFPQPPRRRRNINVQRLLLPGLATLCGGYIKKSNLIRIRIAH